MANIVMTPGQASSVSHRPLQDGRWRRLLNWWRSRFGPSAPQVLTPPPMSVPEVVTLRREVHDPLLVPAQGDAFDFHVFPTLSWEANQMSHDELRYRVDRLMHWALGVVREQATDRARGFAPHRAYDLERALNAEFANRSWPVGARGSIPRFRARVRVLPDPQVRRQLQPYWEQRIQLEWEHELAKLRSDQVDQMTRRWREVLANLEQDPVTAHAARLIEQQRFAEVFAEFVEERRRVVPDLVKLLEEAVKGHGDLQMGPSEYTEAWDLALRTYRRQYGLGEDGINGHTSGHLNGWSSKGR
jgi:hypothetical protein